MDHLSMPIRTIPKNYRNVTGRLASSKSEDTYFESTLERDLFTILDFDPNVAMYDSQPLLVNWVDSNGKQRSYHPDVLITYHPEHVPYGMKETVLCEVKYRDDIKENWAEYKPKFKASIKYAKKRGWRFKLLTENEIRTNFMENARFLLPYMRNPLCDSHEELLLNQLKSLRQTSVEGLIASLFNDKWSQAELIPSLWYLIGTKRIVTDLNLPLVMSSQIWLRG
jgi:hypothetical protein